MEKQHQTDAFTIATEEEQTPAGPILHVWVFDKDEPEEEAQAVESTIEAVAVPQRQTTEMVYPFAFPMLTPLPPASFVIWYLFSLVPPPPTITLMLAPKHITPTTHI